MSFQLLRTLFDGKPVHLNWYQRAASAGGLAEWFISVTDDPVNGSRVLIPTGVVRLRTAARDEIWFSGLLNAFSVSLEASGVQVESIGGVPCVSMQRALMPIIDERTPTFSAAG